jgi:poly(A) polymerase
LRWRTSVGTIGLARHGLRLEVTTYRAEAYDRVSRNPIVRYGQSLEDDLRRRDFTVNAMAVSLPGHVFTDPYGGLEDLAAGLIKTPSRPEESFGDDPLRMLRAARFAAKRRPSSSATGDTRMSSATAERWAAVKARFVAGGEEVSDIGAQAYR